MRTHPRRAHQTLRLLGLLSSFGLAVNACESFGAVDERVGASDGGVPSENSSVGPNGGGKEAGPVTTRPLTDATTDATTEKVADATLDECKLPNVCTRVVFVTSDDYGANFGGVAGADAKCAAAKNAANRPAWSNKQFTAWVSVPGSSAIDRISITGKYVRTDGKPVSTSLADLKGGLLNPISRNQYNNEVPASSSVWTGTQSDGNSVANCSNWERNEQNQPGKTGLAIETSSKWTDERDTACNEKARLYCFEK